MINITDPSEPEYFLEALPLNRFPQYTWQSKPSTLPRDVWISETTHRDGQQGGLPLSEEVSMHIFEILCRFTANSGAIRHAEFFPYRPIDRAVLLKCLELYRSGAPIEPTTWIRATRKDIAHILNLGIRETGLLCSSSDYHTFHKFKPGGRRQAAGSYLDAIECALDNGIRPRVHLEDITRAPISFVLELVNAVMERAHRCNPNLSPRFRASDTLGLGLPFSDIGPPRSIPMIIRALRGAGVASEDIEFHPHNDMHLVVANCLAAIQAGCGVISGTCLGKGERTGNAPVEGVLAHLIGMGYYTEKEPYFPALNDLVELYAEIGEPVSPKFPFFGEDAHRTQAGIHVDGLNKFPRMYAPFNVPQLLGRNLTVALTKDSGIAGVIFEVKRRMGLDLSKDHLAVRLAHQWINKQFDDGRMTPVEWQEIAPIIENILCARVETIE